MPIIFCKWFSFFQSEYIVSKFIKNMNVPFLGVYYISLLGLSFVKLPSCSSGYTKAFIKKMIDAVVFPLKLLLGIPLIHPHQIMA
jgi:hypothetical protein